MALSIEEDTASHAREQQISNRAPETQAEVAAAVQEIKSSIASIREELHAIKNYIARKDQELQEWQEGYDWAKRKELLGEYANWLDVLEMREANASLSKDARAEASLLRATMEVSMENFSLEKIRPHVGDAYSAWSGRAEVLGPVPTADASKEGKIAKVSSSGVQYRTGQGADAATIVRTARVYVWRYASSDTQTNT